MLLGVLSTSSCENLYEALLTYSAESFGEIAIAMATTFYVVFTYRLLANSEAQRRSSTEPYLRIRWYQGDNRTDREWAKTEAFADRARTLLIDAVAFGSDAFDESRVATGNRYLILELSNVRSTPVGWIKLTVKGTLEIPGIEMTPIKISHPLNLQDLQLREADMVEVTMVDLFPIPQPATVTLDIETIEYGAVDGSDVLKGIYGDTQRTANGEFIPTALKDPQPK